MPCAIRYFCVSGHFFVDHLAGFAVGDLGGVDDAGAVFGRNYDAIDENEDWEAEVQIEEAFGTGELEDLAVLIQAIESIGS